MPISKERAMQIFNMVAENRKIMKLCGEQSLDEYLRSLPEFFYPQKLQDKGVDADPTTKALNSLLAEFTPLLRNLYVSASVPEEEPDPKKEGEAPKENPDPENGEKAQKSDSVKPEKFALTDSQAGEMLDSLDRIFSADPNPEQIIAQYLEAHGDKYLATNELQFVSALVGSMRGVHDVMGRNDVIEGLEGKGSSLDYLNEIHDASISTMSDAMEAAIEAEVDPFDENFKDVGKAIYEERKQLLNDQKALQKQLEDLKEAKLKLPDKAVYDTLKLEVLNSTDELNSLAEKRKPLRKAISEAKNNGPRDLDKLIRDYETYVPQKEAAEKEYNAVKERTDKSIPELDKKIKALESEKRALSSLGEEFEKKLAQVKGLPADWVEMVKGIELLSEQLNDPGRMAALTALSDTMDPDAVAEQIERWPREKVLRDGNEMQKYAMAKQGILKGFDKDPGNWLTVSGMFESMEQGYVNDEAGYEAFNKASVEEFRKEVIDKLCPERDKAIPQALEELGKDKDVTRYLEIEKELKELTTLRDNEKGDLQKAANNLSKAKGTLGKALDKHIGVCSTLCTKLRVPGSKHDYYSDPRNWKELLQLAGDKAKDLEASITSAKDRLQKATAALDDNGSKKFENLKKNLAENSRLQDEVGEALINVEKKQGELAKRIRAYEKLEQSKINLTMSIKAESSMETSFCKDTASYYSGHFTADKISAQLDRLSRDLDVPKRSGANTQEYTDLVNKLNEAKTVFSGKAEGWWKKSPDEQKQIQQTVLEELGQKAGNYLTLKEAKPHIWPFASVSGFKRRSAAEDILSYSKSAADMVNNAPELEYKICKRIESCKDQNGKFIEGRDEKLTNARIADFRKNVKDGILEKQSNRELAPSVNEPVRKNTGRVAGLN